MIDIATWRARIGSFSVNVGPSGRRSKVLRRSLLQDPQSRSFMLSVAASLVTNSIPLLRVEVILLIAILLMLSGDVETNPGPGTVADDNTAVYEVFRAHFDQLVTAMGTSPTALIPVLYAKKLISGTDKTNLSTLTGVGNIDKATMLLTAVETTMKAEPRAAQVVRKFCEAVNNQPALRHVADRITTALDQPAVSPTPAATPHTPSLFRKYIDYLKYHYIKNSPELKENKLKIRPKDYIHLNLVSKVAHEENKEFKNECLLSQLYGDVAAIKKKRTSMEMEDIGSSEEPTQHILVEGSPGIGKTVLSWEICRQWAEGKMLQKWDIVLMLQLRSWRVREAMTLSDLFYHDNEHIKQDVLEHVTSVGGKGVFLLLEGFDELTEEQRTEDSILYNLLKGDCLPEASVMVTSRPLASDSLCPEFREKVDQHIEVIGFNEVDIKSYVEAACQKQSQILPDILSYIASNPFVSSVMYIPLQCVILTALYIEKWNKEGRYAPTTLTQLYTDLLISLLVRYMSKYPKYSRYKKATQLSELPPEVYEQVRKLSQLAAEGLKKKQFIFDSIPCDHMGLMQSAEEEVVIGSTVSYCFLHLTLQEYLAALHWSKMDSNCIVRLVSETSLFPLDTLVRNGITKATSHHWPALYFLSGLSKPNQFSDVFNSDPTAAAHDRLDERQFKFGSFIITDFLKFCFGFELSSLFDGIGGRQCNPYFFQLLFESQSRSLTSNLFVNQSVSPMLRRNPLECFVTAWCVTHSNPTTRWNIQFESMSALEEFTRHYEKFVFDSRDCQYGVIAGLLFNPFAHKVLYSRKLAQSLPLLFPRTEFWGMHLVYDSTVANLFSIIHKLSSLKVLVARITHYGADLLDIPPQHCPSLQCVVLTSAATRFLLRSLVLPNINTLSIIHIECSLHMLASSDLDRLRTSICKTTSLKFLTLMWVSTDEEEKLVCAVENNQSLITVTINERQIITKTAIETAKKNKALSPDKLILLT